MVGIGRNNQEEIRISEKRVHDSSKRYGVSRAERKAYKILERYRGGFISRRDGYVIVKIDENGETVILWIRQKPITSKALELFKKIIRGHEYDKLVLLRLYQEADYVKYSRLEIFDEIRQGQ